MQSGIERLLQTKPRLRVQYLVGDDATWSKWADFSELQIWQAVALHSHLDPDLLLGWQELSSNVFCTRFVRDFSDEPSSDADPESLLLSNTRARLARCRTPLSRQSRLTWIAQRTRRSQSQSSTLGQPEPS